MDAPLIDFGFLEELSGGDPVYKYEVLGIFLSTAPDGIKNLEDLIYNTNDFEAIFKQAHALKSSFSIIKVRDMYDMMAKIEELGRAGEDKQAITELCEKALNTFKEAQPVLVAERAKYKPEDS